VTQSGGRQETLADHFARSRGSLPGRYGRLCNILVDGRRLGDCPIGVVRSREEEKRFEEMQWAAIALVGCDADLEVLELRSIAARHDRATADFDATLRAGGYVRLELARIVFAIERAQNEYFASIAGRTQEVLETDSSSADLGMFVYRVYDPARTTIGRQDVSVAVPELATFIRRGPRLRHPSRTLHRVMDAKRYPTLVRLRVHVCHEAASEPTRVMWDPLLDPIDSDAAIDVFNRIRLQKAIKVPEYSENGTFPVWLVFGAQSIRQKFIALSTVQALSRVDAVDPRPFARILVGCYTAGVTFVEPYQKPHYTSLSTTG
jgi:hypothetical protein